MRSVNLGVVVSIAYCLTAANLNAADPWKGAQVLPKEPVRLILRGNATRPGNEYAGHAFQLAWPVRVEKIDGQWIRIGDKGDYTVPPVKGWVRKDEMLRLRDDGGASDDDPPQYLANKIHEANDPGTLAQLLWLCGIYWESQQEPQLAIPNFSGAIRSAFGEGTGANLSSEPVIHLFRPERGADVAQQALTRFPALADAYLRLARLTAKDGASGFAGSPGDGKSTTTAGPSGSDVPWKIYFACADFLFQRQSPPVGRFNQMTAFDQFDSATLQASNGTATGVPRLASEWADQLSAEYGRQVAERAASSKRSDSGVSRPSQSNVRSAAGPATPQTTTANSSNEIAETAEKADALYKHALAVNRSWTDAYLGRGKLFVAKGDSLAAANTDKSSQDSRALYLQAAEQFTLAIQFDPNLREAYRRRAEAFRSLALHKQLRKRYQERARYLSQAAQSADLASQLGKDRDPACLELLAKVIEAQGEVYDDLNVPKNAANYYRQAFYYWQQAGACPNADRGRLQEMLTRCRQRATDRQALVAETSREASDSASSPPIELQFYTPGSNLFQETHRD